MAEPIEGHAEVGQHDQAKLPDDRGDEPWFEPDEYTAPKEEGGETAAEPAPEAEAKPAEKPAKAGKEPPKPEPKKDLTAADWVRLRKMEREAKSMRAEAEQLKSNAERIERERAEDAALKEKDPYAWAQKHKLDFRKVVEHVAKEGDEDPRDVEIRTLKERLEQVEGFTKSARERAEKAAAEAQEATVMQNELTFVQAEITEAGEEVYPHLVKLGAEHVAHEARAWYYAYDQSGQPKDLDEVLGELEEKYRELAEKLAPPKPSGSQSKRLGSPSRENGAVRSVKHEKRSEPALTERAISSRASADRELSDEELTELLAQRIQTG